MACKIILTNSMFIQILLKPISYHQQKVYFKCYTYLVYFIHTHTMNFKCYRISVTKLVEHILTIPKIKRESNVQRTDFKMSIIICL